MKKLIPAILFTSAVAIVALKKYLDYLKKEDKEKAQAVSDHIEAFEKKVESQPERDRLLGLQVDLVMANYLDEKIFLLKHHMNFNDENDQKKMTVYLKDQGYIIIKNDEVVTAEKVVLKDDDHIKEAVLEMSKNTYQNNGVYQGFEIVPQ